MSYWDDDPEEEARQQARFDAEYVAQYLCPKCRSGSIKAHSAAEDRCTRYPTCDYVFRYASAYPDDKEGNALREKPIKKD